MASEQHRGHIVEEITELYKTKKEIFQKDAKEIENRIFPTYETIFHDLKNQLANLDENYEIIIKEISRQGGELQREIDIIINKMKTTINEMKVQHRDILQKQLSGTTELHAGIDQRLMALKEIQKSTDIYRTITYNSQISKEFYKLPPNVSLPKFTPNPLDHTKLYSYLGRITPLYIAKERNILALDLLDYPEIVATVETGNEKLRSVSCLNEEQIWTSGHPNDIECFNIGGSLLQTIPTVSGNCPNDIAVDIDGDIIYSDWATATVNRVDLKSGQTERILRLFLNWKPYYLCVTSSGELLVTMTLHHYDESYVKVVRYFGSTERQTIQYDDEGEPLYSGNNKTKYISENRNLDICVADSGAGAVVVVNQDGKLRYKYTGRPPIHSFLISSRTFEPYGLATDSQGRILTADRMNRCIHILDQDGQFISYIDNCDLNKPWGVCVDQKDNLYVCEFHNGYVKKIKYVK